MKTKIYSEYDIKHTHDRAFKQGKKDMLAKFRVYLTQEESRTEKE